MGLENLKSVFQQDLDNSIDEFSSNVITDVNGTKFTQFSTPPLNELGESLIQGMSWEKLYNPNHSFNDNAGHKGLVPISYPNVSRDNLNIRNPNDGRFGFAGSSRTSAISAVGKLIGQVPFLEGNITEFLKDTGKEPYIVSTIPTSTSDLFSGRTINSNFGGRGLPVERALTDTVRIGKFLTSPDGLLFAAKQNALALQQIPFTTDLNRTQLDGAGYKDFGAKLNLAYRPFYNPLSSLISTFARAGGGTAVPINKSEPGLGTLASSIPGLDKLNDVFDSSYPKFQNDNYLHGSQLAQLLLGSPPLDGRTIDVKAPESLFKTNIGENKYGDDATGLFANKPYPKDLGLYEVHRTFTDGDSEAGINGDKHTLLEFGIKDTELSNRLGRAQYLDEIDKAHPSATSKGVIESKENGMPFYFKDMRDGAYVFFRAFIDGLSENISPNYNPTQYIGRSEPVYSYGQTERDINFTLKLFAQTKDELKMMYKKMNKLTSLCYPEYYKDTFKVGDDEDEQPIMSSYGNRMKPPLTKLRIGELYGNSKSELMGYIKSLSYSVDQNSPYEVEEGKRVPMFIVATISYQVIHSSVPNLETQFYGYIGD